MQFLDPRLQGQVSQNFLGFHEEKKSTGLIRPLTPNCPKLIFRHQTPTPKYHNFEIYFFKLLKILHKTSPYFKILGHFWQNYGCLFPENCKKNIKNLLFGAILAISFLSLVQKNPFLEYLNSNISRTTWSKYKK